MTWLFFVAIPILWFAMACLASLTFNFAVEYDQWWAFPLYWTVGMLCVIGIAVGSAFLTYMGTHS